MQVEKFKLRSNGLSMITLSHKGRHLAIICSEVTTGRQQFFPSGDPLKEPAVLFLDDQLADPRLPKIANQAHLLKLSTTR